MLPVVKYQFQLFPRAIFLSSLLHLMHVGLTKLYTRYRKMCADM